MRRTTRPPLLRTVFRLTGGETDENILRRIQVDGIHNVKDGLVRHVVYKLCV